MTHVAVIDIGKTNAKLALVDTATMDEVAVITRPNTVLPGPPWPHFDLEGHWQFLLDGLAAFHASHGVGAISITTHGASCVLLDENGELAAPMLDYEHPGPDDLASAYDAIRPDFAETGSPRLPMGLNVGAQLHWMFETDPELKDRAAHFVTYPQYWAYRLCGALATDLSSLGCHTDLWAPQERRFSSLVETLGLAEKMAPARPSADVLGTLLPEVVARTGLPAETPVHCGIHDSNASLLPHVLTRQAPFSVISTGTWVIAMSMGGAPVTLDPARDTLINVNALGDPVPSARFMGGREFEMIVSGQYAAPEPWDVARVLQGGVMLLPSVVGESGPFPGRKPDWVGTEPKLGSGERVVAASFYLALMTATCLDLIGHQGDIVVEGPFARNREYCRMLSAAADAPVLVTAATTGTSHGAAMLALDGAAPTLTASDETRLIETSAPFRSYAAAWRTAVGGDSALA